MFQYATAYALATDNNDRFICSDTVLSTTHHTVKELSRIRKTIFRKIIIKDIKLFPCYNHNDEKYYYYKPIPYLYRVCLSGYYQSPKYFKHLYKEINTLFEPTSYIKNYISSNYSDLIDRSNTCAVQIRRGDYLKYNDYHHNLSLDYYSKAFSGMGNDKCYVFFSDDIEWCKQKFYNVSDKFIQSGDDIIDFYLMSMMKNNIIANSSYGWWAAFMNQNDSKNIICPSNWFGPKNQYLPTSDIFPDEWCVIND